MSRHWWLAVTLCAHDVNAGGKAAGGKKPARLSKASLLAQLKQGASGSAAGGSVLGGGVGAGGATAGGGSAEDAPGWKVLQEGFTGLTGGRKMKDWDRQKAVVGSDGEDEDERAMGVRPAGAAAGGSGSSDDGDDDGW